MRLVPLVAALHPRPRRSAPARAPGQPAARHRLFRRRGAHARAAGRIRRDDAQPAAPLRLRAGRSADGRLARGVGHRLGASSDRPQQPFTFFMLRDRQINAFATLGGYIGINAGLVLAAEREDEVAGVLSHEIAHVTQHHVLRGVERAERDSLPILLAMLGAIVVAQQAGGSSSGDATMAAMVGGPGLDGSSARSTTPAPTNPRPTASASRRSPRAATTRRRWRNSSSAAAVRPHQPGRRTQRTPDYLQTHPITTTRISEAKERAAQLANAAAASRRSQRQRQPAAARRLSMPGPALTRRRSGQFGWARERLRVLSANTPGARDPRIRAHARPGEPLDAAQRYGLALARLQAGQAAAAAAELAPLLAAASRRSLARAGDGRSRGARRPGRRPPMRASRRCWRGCRSNRAVALSYAQVLAERSTPAAGKRAQAVLRPLLAQSPRRPVFQQTFARASEIAGDPVRAGEAYAEAAYLNGRPEQALIQLNNLQEARRAGLLRPRPGSTRASPRSPRRCWNCAARASATRTQRAGQRTRWPPCAAVDGCHRHRHKSVVYLRRPPLPRAHGTPCRNAS